MNVMVVGAILCLAGAYILVRRMQATHAYATAAQKRFVQYGANLAAEQASDGVFKD